MLDFLYQISWSPFNAFFNFSKSLCLSQQAIRLNFNLEKLFIFFQIVAVGRFHSITPSLLYYFTPSLSFRHLETWESSHMKRHGLLVEKFEFNS